jgi:L-ascorbate metabolism protein UlaG (beta-lactamase superfamily)
MQIRWYGQSSFLVRGSHDVVIDPFGLTREQAASRGMLFDYPPIETLDAHVLLITHEHADHNAADVVNGSPTTVRATAGTFESPIGPIVAVASEHDDVAGTKRGPNSIVRFELDGLRLSHLGDFGQPALRPEQRAAIGQVDVLFLPVGGSPTIGGEASAAVVRELRPRLVVPMHYRTEAVDFLDPPDAFLDAFGGPVVRLDTSDFAVEEQIGTADAPVVVLPAPPLPR